MFDDDDDGDEDDEDNEDNEEKDDAEDEKDRDDDFMDHSEDFIHTSNVPKTSVMHRLSSTLYLFQGHIYQTLIILI